MMKFTGEPQPIRNLAAVEANNLALYKMTQPNMLKGQYQIWGSQLTTQPEILPFEISLWLGTRALNKVTTPLVTKVVDEERTMAKPGSP